ncbi:acyltransferase [Undibacterium sp. Ji50W]|uniref:acyltransferase n=1 Tax=Undibacterium sp. Ji50W TaxID=3413041 RepID=UPI003BF4354A
MLKALLIALLPKSLRIFLREKITQAWRRLKAPRMIWGYRNFDGSFQELTRISDTVVLKHPEKITIGDNVFVGHHSILDGTGGLEIGEGCQVGFWCGLFTHSSHCAIRLYGRHYQDIPEYEKVAYDIAPVSIGKYVFIGAGCIILPGTQIGDGALVSAGALVAGSFEAFAIISGSPAKKVGDTRTLDKRHLRDPQLLEWYEEWQKS